MTRQRRPTPAEIELWQRAMADAEALPEQPAPGATRTAARALSARGAQVVPAAVALDPDRPVGLDRRSWLRLKRGQVTVENTVDLHGLTQEQAHARLARFLAESQRSGARCVLVVTGKGLLHGGVLRHMVPRWLNEGRNRERVLAFAAAQPKHGGGGALYVLLRRERGG